MKIQNKAMDPQRVTHQARTGVQFQFGTNNLDERR